MIKRKLFFIIEKLQITRSERIAMSLLLISLVILSGMVLITEPKANYDPEHYNELERIFLERSLQAETERAEILARYDPGLSGGADATYPGLHEQETSASGIPEDEWSQGESNIVNINRADSEELQTLPGIGPAYAERIIAWRDEHGEFTDIEQLLEIRGIGERRLEQIRPYVILKDPKDEEEQPGNNRDS